MLLAMLASPIWLSRVASAGSVDLIADMHAHFLFIGENTPSKRPLAPFLAAGNVSLVSWSLVGDLPWIRPTAQGLKQKGDPDADRAWTFLKEEVARARAHLETQALKLALTPEDVARSLKGEPHVVLSVEGATFLADDLARLAEAHALGIRHLQLVHYVQNPIADFQTEKPRHGGLTDFGKAVIAECNRLGILLDLAHMTPDGIRQALAVTTVAPVWSHSSVTRGTAPSWSMPATKARQLPIDAAEAVAEAGGVVGLWALGSDVGRSPEAYAARLAELAEWLGSEHVGIGTDTNALSKPALADYAELARAVRALRGHGLDETAIANIAIGNYARVLTGAMAAAQ